MKKMLSSLLVLASILAWSALAFAQGAANADGWEDVKTAMVQPGEGFPANALVAAAYGFIWLMVAGFVVMVWRRTGAVEREIEALRKRIEERGADARRAG